MKSFEGNDSETNRRRQRVAGKRQMLAMLSNEEEDETPEETLFRLEQEELQRQDAEIKAREGLEAGDVTGRALLQGTADATG